MDAIFIILSILICIAMGTSVILFGKFLCKRAEKTNRQFTMQDYIRGGLIAYLTAPKK